MTDIEKIVLNKRKTIGLDVLNEKELKNLIFRVTKRHEYADKFVFLKTDDESGMDFYRMYDKDNKIIVEASNTITAATAFNYYINEKCKCYFGPITENMNLPEVPPKIGEEYSQRSMFIYRYFMNYCTFSYTMLYWGFEEYEHLMDWMALAGVNLVLNIVGHEIVVRDMLMELGYSKDEAVKYLTGPAYLPWQWMGNISEFGGDLPDWWFEKQKQLGQRINSRLNALGIGVMMPGFYGAVPVDFKDKNPLSKPIAQGFWNEGIVRPSIISWDDEMFDAAADAFYKKTREHFGDISYFSGDPFHEGGKADNIDLKEFAAHLVGKMQEYSPNGVWFLQGWDENPKKEFLSGFKKDEVIVGFLSADKLDAEFEGYGGYPWLYMSTPNFGGTRKQDGNIKSILRDPYKYVTDDNQSMLAGIGMTMEAIEMDEPLFDAFSCTSVRSEAMTDDRFIKYCVTSRYGYINDNLHDVFKDILDKIYVRTKSGTYSGRESLLCARPALHAKRVSPWAFAVNDGYGTEVLRRITEGLYREYERLKNNECYCLDLMDFARQLLAEYGRVYMERFSDAFDAGDKEQFEEYSRKFLELFEVDNQLMASNPRTRLDTWVNRAKDYSESEKDEAMLVFNAKNLLLSWAGKESDANLHDYAYREWSGMVTHYKNRWEKFISMLKGRLCGDDEYEIDWYGIDMEFAKSYETYSIKNIIGLDKAVDMVLDCEGEL